MAEVHAMRSLPSVRCAQSRAQTSAGLRRDIVAVTVCWDLMGPVRETSAWPPDAEGSRRRSGMPTHQCTGYPVWPASLLTARPSSVRLWTVRVGCVVSLRCSTSWSCCDSVGCSGGVNSNTNSGCWDPAVPTPDIKNRTSSSRLVGELTLVVEDC